LEYGWKCFTGTSLEEIKVSSLPCKIAPSGASVILIIALVLAVASFSYEAEPLMLEKAVNMALSYNPGLKAAGPQIEAADAGVLRLTSGFLPKVTLSDTWSRTDNPLMVLGTKLNKEIVTPADFNPAVVINNPSAILNYNT
jgi:outer membrane efflux protein